MICKLVTTAAEFVCLLAVTSDSETLPGLVQNVLANLRVVRMGVENLQTSTCNVIRSVYWS